MTTRTAFYALLRGELTLAEAQKQGLVVIEGNEAALDMVRVHFLYNGQAPPQRP